MQDQTLTVHCHGSLDDFLPRYYNEFWRCKACGQIYWRGSHMSRMQAVIDRVFGQDNVV